MELAENMDTAAEVAGVVGCIQSFPGQYFDLQELAFVFFRAVHCDDHRAAIVADAFWLEACAAKGGFDDDALFGFGECRQGRVLSPDFPFRSGLCHRGFYLNEDFFGHLKAPIIISYLIL